MGSKVSNIKYYIKVVLNKRFEKKRLDIRLLRFIHSINFMVARKVNLLYITNAFACHISKSQFPFIAIEQSSKIIKFLGNACRLGKGEFANYENSLDTVHVGDIISIDRGVCITQ